MEQWSLKTGRDGGWEGLTGKVTFQQRPGAGGEGRASPAMRPSGEECAPQEEQDGGPEAGWSLACGRQGAPGAGAG